jgi:hypothetical protein
MVDQDTEPRSVSNLPGAAAAGESARRETPHLEKSNFKSSMFMRVQRGPVPKFGLTAYEAEAIGCAGFSNRQKFLCGCRIMRARKLKQEFRAAEYIGRRLKPTSSRGCARREKASVSLRH